MQQTKQVKAEHQIKPKSRPRISTVRFGARARKMLAAGARRVALMGDSDTPGVAARCAAVAKEVLATLPKKQRETFAAYQANEIPALLIDGLIDPLVDRPLPEALPSPEELAQDPLMAILAVRTQILLAMVGERAFAYDQENDGKIVRFVANFKGGGSSPIANESADADQQKSSHHGGLLGAHTEGPYFSTQACNGGHSPAASALALTAPYNPLAEPTNVLPITDMVSDLGLARGIALTKSDYAFGVSDSYAAGAEAPEGVPILELTRSGAFAIRFNVHRARALPTAPPVAGKALEALKRAIAAAKPIPVTLTPARVLLINNALALHGRDVIRDNRRLLVRLFSYRSGIVPNVICADPLRVRG